LRQKAAWLAPQILLLPDTGRAYLVFRAVSRRFKAPKGMTRRLVDAMCCAER